MIERNQTIADFKKMPYQCIVDALSETYFAQAASETERATLLQKVQAQSRITVLDPDLFATPPNYKPVD